MSDVLTDNDLMPYGMHKGVKMANVPEDYLIYLYDHGQASQAVAQYVEENEEDLRDNA